jgi:hypothetical protein
MRRPPLSSRHPASESDGPAVDAEPFDEDQRALRDAYVATRLTVEDLWLRYFALGGNAGKVEIEAYLSGLMPLPSLQHNILAHAINERLDELGPPPRAPYRPDAPDRS